MLLLVHYISCLDNSNLNNKEKKEEKEGNSEAEEEGKGGEGTSTQDALGARHLLHTSMHEFQPQPNSNVRFMNEPNPSALTSKSQDLASMNLQAPPVPLCCLWSSDSCLTQIQISNNPIFVKLNS